jgi:Fur family ferric uptake transcriptional regulator
VLQRLQVSQSPENKFREFLLTRPKPQRFTVPQREMVKHIFSSHNHFDADQLCADLEKAQIDISRATVYRTLAKLVDAGMLREMRIGPRVVYEHDYGYPQHGHLHCDRCGKIVEFARPEIESVLQDICRQQQFQATGTTVVIRGTCAECNRAKISKRRLDLV